MDVFRSEKPICHLRAALVTSIMSMLTVVAGTPENPWLWSSARDALGLPWNKSQLVQEVLIFIVILDCVGVGILLHRRRAAASQPKPLRRRRPSLGTQTAHWFADSVSSGIRTLRTGSKDACGEKKAHDSGDEDCSTDAGSSRAASPCVSPSMSPCGDNKKMCESLDEYGYVAGFEW